MNNIVQKFVFRANKAIKNVLNLFISKFHINVWCRYNSSTVVAVRTGRRQWQLRCHRLHCSIIVLFKKQLYNEYFVFDLIDVYLSSALTTTTSEKCAVLSFSCLSHRTFSTHSLSHSISKYPYSTILYIHITDTHKAESR